MKYYIIKVEMPTGSEAGYDLYKEDYSGIVHTNKKAAESELRRAKKDQFVYNAYMEVIEE